MEPIRETHTWSQYVEPRRGANTWSPYVEPRRGAQTWSPYVGRGGVAVCSVPCNRRVTDWNLPQAAV